MKKNHITLAFIGLFILIILAVLYFNNKQQTNIHKQPPPIEGYGITLHEMYQEMIKSFIIEESDDILSKIIKVSNNTSKNTNFTLSIYIDYVQVDFSVDNKLIDNIYNFDLKNREEVMIPISLPLDKIDSTTSHQLVIAVASGADKHARTLNTSSDFYGVVARYNLRHSQNFNSSNVEYIVPSYLTNGDYSGILINQDFKDTPRFNYPSLTIKANPEEKVDLAVRIGGGNVKNYIFWITLNWKQTQLYPSDNSAISFQNKAGQISYFNISITAPKEKGDYELCGYLIANPWKQLDDGFSQDIGSSTSYRITLHVE